METVQSQALVTNRHLINAGDFLLTIRQQIDDGSFDFVVSRRILAQLIVNAEYRGANTGA